MPIVPVGEPWGVPVVLWGFPRSWTGSADDYLTLGQPRAFLSASRREAAWTVSRLDAACGLPLRMVRPGGDPLHLEFYVADGLLDEAAGHDEGESHRVILDAGVLRGDPARCRAILLQALGRAAGLRHVAAEDVETARSVMIPHLRLSEEDPYLDDFGADDKVALRRLYGRG